MKRSSINFLAGILLVTVTVFFLFACASKSKTTQPGGPPEQPKPASKPSTQETATPPPSPREPSTTTATTTPPSPPTPKTPEVSQSTAQRATEIVPALVNFRQGPSMDSKIIKVLKKGTKLTVLQEKEDWLRVQLEDGTEGWVGKAMTSAGTQPKRP
jgi:type IV secretory pathway VirB10-like protein